MIGHTFVYEEVQSYLVDTIPSVDFNTLSNLREKIIKPNNIWQELDTITVVNSSVSVYTLNSTIPLDSTKFEMKNDSIRFFTEHLDFLIVKYRILDINLGQIYTRFDSTLVVFDNDGILKTFEYDIYDKQSGIVDFKGLDYQGSFSRGLSFGNTQNLVLNSNFNLQMAGEIGDGVQVLAAISDENLPIQPEGNTQKLSEFERIYIQLSKDRSTLITGDYDLRKPVGYFLNYNKKLQGASLENSVFLFDKKLDFYNKASVAVSRGKFSRNVLPISEGNQGPYKLEGNNGERFILILSGTEKVFWDGKLLTRGRNHDYIIDYNQGTIQFSPKRLITKDSRIIVEFDYSDQNYLRSLVVFNSEIKSEKWTTYLNAYTEQDSKSNTTTGELSQEENEALLEDRNNGNNVLLQPSKQLNEGGFDEFRVYYTLRDTSYVCQGQAVTDSILVYAVSPQDQVYSAQFVKVPLGTGDYLMCDTCAANGAVFLWVPPNDNCVPQGDHINARILIPPKKQQLISIGGIYNFTDKFQAKTEFGLSNIDNNRLALNQDGLPSSQGYSLRTDFNYSIPISKKDSSNLWIANAKVGYEFKEKKFVGINNYRTAEFNRDWNLSSDSLYNTDFDEHLLLASFGIAKNSMSDMNYTIEAFNRKDNYQGAKHTILSQLNKKGWIFNGLLSLLNSKSNHIKTQFIRPSANLSKRISKAKYLTLGYIFDAEQNKKLSTPNDSLLRISTKYWTHSFFAENLQNEKFGNKFTFTQRNDFGPDNSDFNKSTKAIEYGLEGHFLPAKHSNLRYRFNFRNLQIVDSLLTNQQPAKTYLGRLDYILNLYKGTIQSNTGYELGSGQEQKIAFQYIKVEPGQGNFQWRDYNMDQIVQTNEIESVAFQDSANVQRIVLFTDDFIRVNSIQINQSISLNPRNIWFGQKRFKGALTKFSTQSNIQLLRKNKQSDIINPFNPFQLNISDTLLVSTTQILTNHLYFNRSNQKFGIQLTQNQQQRKRILNTGFESNKQNSYLSVFRWNISKSIGLKVSGSIGDQQQDSELFNNKDYLLNLWSIEPQLTIQPNTKFNIKGKFSYTQKNNILSTGFNENAITRDINLTTTISNINNSTIRASISLVNIDYNGEVNTPVGFAILEGLQPGQNYLWSLSLDQQLSTFLRLNLSYNGRKIGTSNIAHIARAQVSATF